MLSLSIFEQQQNCFERKVLALTAGSPIVQLFLKARIEIEILTSLVEISK